MIIIDKAKTHFNQKLPFALYRLPNQNTIKGIFQLTDKLYSFKAQEGFVFQSFNQELSCCLPFSESIISEEILFNKKETICQIDDGLINETEKKDFEKMIFSAVEAIKNKQFEKVVLSRKIRINYNKSKDIFEVFLKALSVYQTAFVYIFYHPKIGFWLGATPELLLSLSDKNFETVALAGTKLPSENRSWTTKEIKEQAFVTNYISYALETYATNINVSSTETVLAGHLEHLKTTIFGKLKSDVSVLDLLKTLHPTPAVCGMPKASALDFIKKNENYDRNFYTGFLGEHSVRKSNFFVNLRCLQFLNNFVEIYVGCGIIENSEPEKEFFETVNKANVMKKIL